MISRPARLARAEVMRAGDRAVIVRVADRDGRIGWGEASPLPGRSPESPDVAAAALEGALADLLAGPETRDLPATAGAAAAIARERITASAPSARFALEAALVDLAAQARGSSVAALLAEERGAAPLDRLACSAVVEPTGPDAALAAEIATFKVKLGDPDRLEQDLAALRRWRRGALRLDVNRRWSEADCERWLPRLAELEPDWVEEPGTAAVILALAARRGPEGLPVALALDESLVDEVDGAIQAIERGLVRAVVLKPALLGGLAAAAAWAARARAAGVVPVVSHLFDGPVALAAYAELALALAAPGDPAAGLGPHRGLDAIAPGARVMQLVDGGAEMAAHRGGLGVDEEAVLAACAPRGAA